jgi:hypothetical protein
LQSSTKKLTDLNPITTERRQKMHFMTIYTYEPARRNEIVKRRSERGPIVPEGAKVIGEWSYTGGGRGFIVFEAQDPKVMEAPTLAWSDLIKLETLPVREPEEVMKLAKTAVLPGVEMKL